MASITRRELISKALPALAVTLSFGSSAEALAEAIMKRPDKRAYDEFANSLWTGFRERLSAAFASDFSSFCAQNGLDCSGRKIGEEYLKTRFFHELMKNRGIMGNRYISEEDRAGIAMADGGAYPEKENIFARLPKRMISDMFSGKPRYVWDGRPLHCFGDCDELEMAYATLLKAVGIQGKVVMIEPAHVNTLVEIGLKDFLVDNSRRIFARARACGGACRDYRIGPDGFSSGKSAKLYIERANRIADEEEDVDIFPAGASRAERLVNEALRKIEGGVPKHLACANPQKG